ncbi:MAG: hypothetical protein IJS71_09295 [Clostridia bacterium]|nr:hypothetical protein [Clostridia bacterium]
MKAEDFWKTYNSIYKKFEYTGFRAVDRPVDPLSKYFEEGLFQNDNGTWCVEETSEKGKAPFHWEFGTEDEAVDTVLRECEGRKKLAYQ